MKEDIQGAIYYGPAGGGKTTIATKAAKDSGAFLIDGYANLNVIDDIIESCNKDKVIICLQQKPPADWNITLERISL